MSIGTFMESQSLQQELHEGQLISLEDTLATASNYGQESVPVNVVGTSGNQISNAEFIRTVFHALPPNASVLVCSKEGDPSNFSGWPAVPVDRLEIPLPDDANNYVNCGSFYRDAGGGYKARKENFAGCNFIMLDDIGTKVPFDRFGKFELSWLIETSPGNYQGGLLFKAPLNKDEASNLLDSLIKGKYCDPGSTGAPTRWARQPVGINGKKKYRGVDGSPFQCRLTHWNPQARYTSQEIIDGLGLSIAEEAEPVLPESKPPVLTELQDLEDPVGTLAKLKVLLDVVSPDCSYADWLKVLMVIFHETGGSDDGLYLADHWSSKGDKYQGNKEVELKWKSFVGRTENPLTMRTLMSMAAAAGADVPELMLGTEDGFVATQTVVVAAAVEQEDRSGLPKYYLERFSVTDDIEALERGMVEQVPLLGKVALMGQATTIYAASNTGKTLLALYLLVEAIKNGRVEPEKLFYLNMDDNSVGLVEKARIAKEYGFRMIAGGFLDFDAADFRKSMKRMIENGTAHGVVLVLDTLTKFTNPMDKNDSRDFARDVRQFVMKGGTVVALAHTNKNRSADGKSKFAGTSDVLDNFDCAYVLDTVQVQDGYKIVEFENIKRRGNVVSNAAYSYFAEDSASYLDRFLSIQEVNELQLTPIKKGVEISSDLQVISAIQSAIQNGTNTKMKLIDEVRERLSVPGRAVGVVLEKYTGTDPSIHRWKFVRGERGAHRFILLS